MQTITHQEPIIDSGALARPEMFLLSDAFSEFISASARLEYSYGQLQLEVTQLSHELADRNAALKSSLEENERVHRALQQIVDSMPCGVLVVEPGGMISMINPEGRQLLGLDSSCADHLDLISVAAGVDLAGVLSWNGTEEEREFCRVSPSGKRWLAVQHRRLFHDDESAWYDSGAEQTILILRDITIHKQTQEERERARKAIALSEVATTLAHEIRNPLTSLELFAGLIADGGEDSHEWVSHLRAGIRSLAGTVNNVLSLHGGGFVALSPLDLAASVRSSVEFVRPIADEAGVKLRFDSDCSGIRVRGNSSALQQVVLNIACNAIRHTAKGGLVTVYVSTKSDRDKMQRMAKIQFTDTGCGIAPEHLKEIFRAGFSASGTSSGLGLAVCSQIVSQHEGTIRVTSSPGAGTSFVVEIPTL